MIDGAVLESLATEAWKVRSNAFIYGNTRVGSALLAEDGSIHCGCNVEHQYRSHDVHAEVNAIGNMVASGRQRLVAIVIVAERKKFTPCGSCMDWIFQFGGGACVVAFQPRPGGPIETYTAQELMPHYPE